MSHAATDEPGVAVEQSCHAYVKVGAGEPLHEPSELTLNVWPTVAVPEIVGGDVFAGGAWTRALGELTADTGLPTPLLAVTTTRT